VSGERTAGSPSDVGAGIGVLQGWHPWGETRAAGNDHPPLDAFRRQTRDLYVPSGDIGMWQGALRDPDEDVHSQISAARAERRVFSIDLLYTDQVGDQRTITRSGITPASTEDRWLGNVLRHWSLDRAGPG
jgi:hypothetical protein